MSRWYRAYEGTVTDAKLGEVALVAGCSRSVAIAAWHCVLESAASSNSGGSFDASPRRVAVILGEEPSLIEKVFAELQLLGMIEGQKITAWSKRQYESDSSTERSRKSRERSKAVAGNTSNTDATAQQRCATPPETDTDTEVVLSAREASEKLEGQLREAAGWNSKPFPNLFVTGPIEALMSAGADLEMDILPVIRRDAPRCRSPNWKFFTDAIAQARDTRLAAGKLKFEGKPNAPNVINRNTILSSLDIAKSAIEAELSASLGDSGTQYPQDAPGIPRLRQMHP